MWRSGLARVRRLRLPVALGLAILASLMVVGVAAASTVTGTVYRGSGAGVTVSGAAVHAVWDDGFTTSDAVSASGGTYSIDIGPSTSAYLTVTDPISGLTASTNATNPAFTGVDLHLPDYYAISGHVYAGSIGPANAVVGAAVSCGGGGSGGVTATGSGPSIARPAPACVSSATTDGTGAFTLYAAAGSGLVTIFADTVPSGGFPATTTVDTSTGTGTGGVVLILGTLSLSGTVYHDVPASETVPGASVYACTTGGLCSIAVTAGAGGTFTLTNVLPNQNYTVHANPVVGTAYLPGSTPVTVTTSSVGGISVTLPSTPPPPPPGLVTDVIGSIGGVPVINWGVPHTLTFVTCPGQTNGTFTATFTGPDGNPQGYVDGPHPMTEGSPAGTYTALWGAVFPHHGAVTLTFSFPGCGADTDVPIYIDPSGKVFDSANGNAPISGATVRIFYSADGTTGSFTEIFSSDPKLDPSTPNAPELTAADGSYGWNVVPGYWFVRASALNPFNTLPCTASSSDSTPYKDSAVLTIPPAATGIDLYLYCVNGSGGGGGGGGGGASDTPELDSLLLFGTGLAGLAGYVRTRRRARRSVSGK